jgi:flap endonuclease-1
MIKEYGKLEDIPKIQDQLEQIDYKQIRKIFLQPEIQDIGEIVFKDTDYSGIIDYLANERSFSQERVQSSLNRLKKSLEKRSHTLDQWFK